jgi:hypothetical protein
LKGRDGNCSRDDREGVVGGDGELGSVGKNGREGWNDVETTWVGMVSRDDWKEVGMIRQGRYGR